MDVAVLYQRAQRWLHEVARPAVFGTGMLERARATSLALLGLIAAVGLAIVALALNQGRPLVADSSIPRIPPVHQGVDQAKIVAAARSRQVSSAGRADSARLDAGATSAPPVGGGGIPAATPEPATAEPVVAPADPREPRDDSSNGSPEDGQPAPSRPEPAPTGRPAPGSPPPAQPVEVIETTPPDATVSEAPPAAEESYVPSWSKGKGHAYGRSDHDG
jgi:hypothetical protein